MKCRGFWTTEQPSSSFFFSPGKMLLTMFIFQKWLSSPFTEDVWAWWLLMHLASVLSLWSSPKCLNQLCLTLFSSLRSYLLLVHIFVPNLFQWTLHLICFDTAICEDPHLSVMTLCDFPSLWNDCLLDHCRVSTLPHYCGFKEQEIPRIYTVGMVIYFLGDSGFLTFMSCKL